MRPQSDGQAPKSAPAARGERARVIPEQRSAAGTVRRPAAVSVPTVQGTPAEEAGTRPHRSRNLAIAFVALLIVGGGTAAILSRGPANSSGTTPPTTGSHPQNPGVTPTPGTPVVRYTPNGSGSVIFRWKYAHPLPSDFYMWQRTGDGASSHGDSSVPRLLVKTKKRHEVCLSVQVHRRDGSLPPASRLRSAHLEQVSDQVSSVARPIPLILNGGLRSGGMAT